MVTKKSVFVLAILALLVMLTKTVHATHIMGGEITWECQANGQYIFSLKVYRDCNGVGLNVNNEAIEAHNYPTNGAITLIPLTFFSVADITPSCSGSPCATLQQSDPDIPGAIEEYVLVSNPVTLNGVPPANGWTFTWTSGNRNAAIDNINNAQNFGITLRAKMFPYQARNANPCFDSSPDFFQKPSSIICAASAFTYNHSAFDDELDSLSYSWAQPLDGNACGARPCQIGGVFQENVNPPNVQFDAGNNYAFNSPFPGTTLDARNIPAQLDPNTGDISFTSYTQGEFVSVIRVEAFKCGDKIAEIYRELQTVILSGCAVNEPPEIPSPFANGTFSDTVKAGDFVDFNFEIFDTLRTGNPKIDSLYIFGSGQQFGNNFTDSTTGCANPPCATLTNPLPDTAFGSYSSNFRWQTSCDHLALGNPICATSQNTYLFVVRAFDDFCPAAGQSVATFSITVLAEQLMEHPEIHCADVQANGDVIIDWNQTADPDSSFRQWKIYTSTNRNGPYTLIDSISNVTTTSYTHLGAGANNQSIHYIVRAESGCHGDWLISPTDTISSMFINPTFNNICVNVSWNELDNPLPAGSGANYEIYREYPIGSGFSLYKTSATTNFCDSFPICSDSVTYRIDISNTGNGCSGSSSNVKGIRFQYPDPPIDAGNDINICDGQSAVLGGTPTGQTNATYLWSPAGSLNNPNSSNPTSTTLATTKYFLTVTDSLGCQSIDSINLSVQPTPRSSTGNDTAICVENFPYTLQGSVSVSGTGRWIGGNGTFTPDRNTLNASYQPTVNELNSSQIQLSLVSTNFGICDPDTNQLTITINRFSSALVFNQQNVSCNGGNDGYISASATGANGPYSFQWNTLSGLTLNDSIGGLTAGSYSFTVTNNLGCDSIGSITITEPNPLALSTNVLENVNCNGGNNGRIRAIPTGGTSPYTYLWSDGQITDTARNLSAGIYTLTLTDQNGCTLTESATITEPSALVGTFSDTNHVSCNGGNDGQVVVSSSGGTPPYTYLWSDGQTLDTAKNLTAGNYSFTLSDLNGCSVNLQITINEPAVLQNTINTIQNVSCNGLSDGSAKATPSGGTPPYTYLWSDGQTQDSLSGLTAGTYFLTVTDLQNCIVLDTVTITEPIALASNRTFQRNISCKNLSDGVIALSPNGGTSPYTYLWSNGQTQDSLINVVAGSYSVTVTDAQGCSVQDTFTLSEPDSLLLSTNVISNVSCNGNGDGSAFVVASGGTAPYTYLWSNGSNNDSISNLSPGSYFITVTDQNNCSSIDSISISTPQPLTSATSLKRNVSCFGGSDGQIISTISGGTQPYTYVWSNGQSIDTAKSLSAGIYRLTVTDFNGCTTLLTDTISQPNRLDGRISSQSAANCFGANDGFAVVTASDGTPPYTYLWSDNQQTDTARNLAAGTYQVTITDNNNCQLSLQVIITEPDTLVASLANKIDVSCKNGNDGSININAIGGTLPYTYNWSNGSTNSLNTNLAAGSYTVTVTDALGCTDTSTIIITEPDSLVSSIQIDSLISCNGTSDGTASAIVSGGTTPYTYVWSHGPTSATVNNLNAGNYSVTVTDSNRCISISNTQLSQPNPLNAGIDFIVDVSCFGANDGRAKILVSGGTNPYTYQWSNGASTDSLTNLPPNLYTVTVTDSNGCSVIQTVSINQPRPFVASISGQDISCFGNQDGEIYTRADGGTRPYTYTWSNGGFQDTLRNLNQGTYTLTLSDANACSQVLSYTINEPSELVLTVTENDTICINDSILLNATAQGGTGNYTFNWNNNLGSNRFIKVSPQTRTIYSVSVTDSENCPTVSDQVVVDVRDIARDSLKVSSSGNICVGDSSLISVYFDGSIGPFSYRWNRALNGISDQYVSPPSSRHFTLTVTDACNNSISDSVLVEVSNRPPISLNDTLIAGCEDLTVSFSNATPPNYLYQWNFGDGGTSTLPAPTYTYTEPGTYRVNLVVSTPQGCAVRSDVEHIVNVFNGPDVEIGADPRVTDIKNAMINFYGEFSDAESWLWLFGDGTDSTNIDDFFHTYQDTGTYNVSLYETNSLGCIDSAFTTIRINPNYEINIPNVFIPNSSGSNGGRYNPNSISNEVFYPFLEYVEEYHLMIFNRWGELMFETKDKNIGWDGYYKGKLCQADVYVYKLEVQFIDGSRATKVGDVTLLR